MTWMVLRVNSGHKQSSFELSRPALPLIDDDDDRASPTLIHLCAAPLFNIRHSPSKTPEHHTVPPPQESAQGNKRKMRREPWHNGDGDRT